MLYHNLFRSASFFGLCDISHKSLFSSNVSSIKQFYDAVIIGAGHNGLVAANYLKKYGKSVCVLERRHVIGGAAVTEEILPGFKFSRASYLLSLLRPIIIEDLELKKYGLKTFERKYYSYTPLLGASTSDHSLLLSTDSQLTNQQISQYSKRDANSYFEFDKKLTRISRALYDLFDYPPIDGSSSLLQLIMTPAGRAFLKCGLKFRKEDYVFLQELLLKPCDKILDKWFESEPLKATLATDSMIGFHGPKCFNTGYVLLHHCMGQIDNKSQAWGFVEGGMGAVSNAIAKSAIDKGVEIYTDQEVSEILVDKKTRGVKLKDGRTIQSDMVLSNATPHVTFLDLLPKGSLPRDYEKEISRITYYGAVTKINVAVNKLPNFLANANKSDNKPLPHHGATIHLNTESIDMLNDAYTESLSGQPSPRPMIEMTIPSVYDKSLAPPDCHVVQLFTQYTPYRLRDGLKWDENLKNKYADRVFSIIDQYAPGFSNSVIMRDILSPVDLESVFNLTGGDIFHGALTLDQFYNLRPVASTNYSCPIKGLYVCGSGAHPGGGVSGAPGRLAALSALNMI